MKTADSPAVIEARKAATAMLRYYVEMMKKGKGKRGGGKKC